MAVPRVYVRRGNTGWSVTSDIRLTQDALTLIFLYLYTIGPKGAKIYFLIWSFRECFSEAESASIRSAAKFCFDLDVRIFSNFPKKYFFDRSKMFFSDFGEIFGNMKNFENPY